VTGPDDAVRLRLQSQTTQLWSPPGVIDLGIGQPQNEILPLGLFSAALATAARTGQSYPLQYGIERGDGFLRAALSDFLSGQQEALGASPSSVDPDLIFITNGNSQAIDLCCAVFSRPGDVVLVEEPTYFLALDIFRNHGLTVVGVPVDDDGLRVDALRDALSRYRPAFVYTIPDGHNPTGATLSAQRRQRLVELAVEHGVLVLADEVYHLLRYGADPGPAPLAAALDSGVVLSLNTFSKILAPGLRLGWIQAAEPLLARLESHGLLVSGGGLNPFTASIVARVLADGSAADYLAGLRETFIGRIAVMGDALDEHLSDRVSYHRPDAGYFFWLRFPDGVDTAQVRPRARELGVGYQPGRAFSTVGGLPAHLRLSFAYYPADVLPTAVELLGRAFAD
jgi:2-aminoadipate transaminase